MTDSRSDRPAARQIVGSSLTHADLATYNRTRRLEQELCHTVTMRYFWTILIVLPALGALVNASGSAAVKRAATRSQPVRTLADDRPLPEYITGDECLFCHRFETAQSWQDNSHNRTIRRGDIDLSSLAALRKDENLAAAAETVQFVMGRKSRVRFLRKGQGYGRLELLSTQLIPATADHPAQLLDATDSTWDTQRFGTSCAGCHTTQTDSRTKSFAAVSLDCYVCHGNATLEHTKDTSQMLLARTRKDSPRVVASLCGQCHLRGGQSKATGLPFANNFIAGEDLFGDFTLELSAADDVQLNPGDRHVYHNVRTILDQGEGAVTCLNCHSVHTQTTNRHRRLPRSDICLVCHQDSGTPLKRPSYQVHSTVCGY